LSSPSQSIEPEALSLPSPPANSKLPLYGGLAVLTLGLLAYSQTKSFFWDEGFHILAAYLIHTGKRPYLDFFFPQTPLNAYWNAAWMGLFGPSWRVVHAVAVLATMGSVILLVEYVFSLFRGQRSRLGSQSSRQVDWQLAAAFAGLALFGLRSEVWIVGTISQAYPLCLFLVVAAFRIAIMAVARPGFRMSALAGLCAGAAAACSLLTAAVSPVLLIWMWLNNRAGNRWIKSAGFVGGALMAFVPVLALFARGPHQVIFNILKYHTLYRRVSWAEATSHDIGVATDWVNSSPTLLFVLLAIAGLFFMQKNEFFFLEKNAGAWRRAEFWLCLWLALAIGAQNLLAHPTFPMYFVFMIPFLTVLAVLGFCGVVERLGSPGGPGAAVTVLACVLAACLTNSLYEYYTYRWPELKEVADRVKQVTPQGGSLYAPEHIYFLTRWPVPSGMEHADAHKLDLGPAENAALHVLPKAEVDRQIQAGVFSTAVVCEDPERVNVLKGWNVYAQAAEVEECTIFWQFKKEDAQPPQ
jgi:4-amino-4-deoxy-L-arabinose transferase-like glycosyltransferase